MNSIDTSASNWTVLSFSGAATSAARRALRRNLLRAVRFSGSGIIVDFTGCHSLNHEDIGFLLDCLGYIAGRDTEILLAAGSPVIRVLLDVTRVSSLVPVFDSIDDALASRQRPRASGVIDPRMSESQRAECVR